MRSTQICELLAMILVPKMCDSSKGHSPPYSHTTMASPETANGAPAVPSTAPVAPTEEPKRLSGAELKKQKKAEKEAKRKAEKGAAQPVVPPAAAPQRRPSSGREDSKATTAQHKRTGSVTHKTLPARPSQLQKPAEQEEKPVEDKSVALFAHLYSKERPVSISGAGREIHPAVLRLGLQLRNRVICGGTARCVALLRAFKEVIRAYNTPPGTALSRHLTMHISHQISYITLSRQLSTSQGNAIRWLKQKISKLDVNLSDSDAIEYICGEIDQTIHEKVFLANKVIADNACKHVKDGDVVMTYGKSCLVEKTLTEAKRWGKKFTVVVVDSEVHREGKHLAEHLVQEGIRVQYCLLRGLSRVVGRATKCFLGAASMNGNGSLTSRAGTGAVAMMAKEMARIPVIVLCQTLKFTSRAPLDSVVSNELADPDELGVSGWREQEHLQVQVLVYDVTPADNIDVVITEKGQLPPAQVAAVSAFDEES